MVKDHFTPTRTRADLEMWASHGIKNGSRSLPSPTALRNPSLTLSQASWADKESKVSFQPILLMGRALMFKLRHCTACGPGRRVPYPVDKLEARWKSDRCGPSHRRSSDSRAGESVDVMSQQRRTMTIAERKRAQGFPDTYRFAGTVQEVRDRSDTTTLGGIVLTIYRLAAGPTDRERHLRRDCECDRCANRHRGGPAAMASGGSAYHGGLVGSNQARVIYWQSRENRDMTAYSQCHLLLD